MYLPLSQTPLLLSLSKHTHFACLPLLLAACSQDTAGPDAPAAHEERIACALGGSDSFSSECGVGRSSEDGKKILVVRHPDGGFRRFVILTEPPGIAVADGAEQAMFAPDGPYFEVYVGDDIYRLPPELRIVESAP